MELAKQLIILTENQPGTLANICGSLSDAKINITGLMVVDHVDHAMVRMTVDKPKEALHLLGESGLPVLESDVIRVELPTGPGKLEFIAQALGEAGLNINYIYATEAPNGRASTLFLATNNNAEALKVLKKMK